jgi:hypothetical protein
MNLRFEGLSAPVANVTIFCDIVPRSSYAKRRFGRRNRLHLQGRNWGEQESSMWEVAWQNKATSQLASQPACLNSAEYTSFLEPALAHSYPAIPIGSPDKPCEGQQRADQSRRCLLPPTLLPSNNLCNWYPGFLDYSAWPPAIGWSLARLILHL